MRYKIATLEEVLQAIDQSKPVAYDSETIGLYGKIRIGQFYQSDWSDVLVVNWPDPIKLLSFFAQLKECTIVMQFAHYDITTIQQQLGFAWIPDTFEDTFLLSRLAYPKLTDFKLDNLIEYTLGYDPYKKADIDKKEMQNANWNKLVLPEKQLVYASIDVFYLLDVYDVVKVQLDSMSYKLDMLSLRYALDFQNNGMPVDNDRLMQRYRENLSKIEEVNLPINCNSYQQVRPYIGSNESDDLALARLALQGNERAANVRQVRKLTKENSFLNKFQNDESRIYGKFIPSARSGRFTSKDQNLQQLPRKTKSLFGLPENGDRVLLYSDYSQLELRCVAALTREKVMFDLYMNGEDLHNYVAAFTFGEDFTKDDRQIAKTENFNLLYGGGAGMLQSILLKDANIIMDIDRVKRLARKWKKLFPSITQWQERGIRAYNRGSVWSTPLGRQYVGKMMTDQLNIQNQGFGAEIAKLAMHYMMPHLKEHDALLCDFVHDSYIIEMDNDPDRYKVVAKLVAEAMREAWSEGSKMVEGPELPMPVKVNVGYNWGDIEAGQFIYEHRIES